MKFGSICQEPLIRESKEKPARTHKKPTLYDVVSIGEPIIPKHVAVVPEFLNDSAGVVRHGRRFVFFAMMVTDSGRSGAQLSSRQRQLDVYKLNVPKSLGARVRPQGALNQQRMI